MLSGSGMDLTALAQAAYEGYGDAVKWRAVNGDQLPAWDHVMPTVRAAWVAAVASVRDAMLIELRGEKP